MSEEWVTVASFFTPPEPEAAFEDMLESEKSRFVAVARDAGLPPDAHIRLTRGHDEVTIDISQTLNTAFTPEQTLWKAE